MKNKLFSLLLAGIATLTIQAQTDYARHRAQGAVYHE